MQPNHAARPCDSHLTPYGSTSIGQGDKHHDAMTGHCQEHDQDGGSKTKTVTAASAQNRVLTEAFASKVLKKKKKKTKNKERVEDKE